MAFKLVFYVEDTETKEIIGEKKQITIEVNEADLVKVDEKDAADLKKANEMIGGDCAANRMAWGRGKYIRQLFQATGFTVGKHLERLLSERLGSPHIAMLDAAATQKPKSTGISS